MKTLPNNIDRCDGVSYEEDGVTYWRKGCENCLRRIAPRDGVYPFIYPPTIIAFECEFLIESQPN